MPGAIHSVFLLCHSYLKVFFVRGCLVGSLSFLTLPWSLLLNLIETLAFFSDRNYCSVMQLACYLVSCVWCLVCSGRRAIAAVGSRVKAKILPGTSCLWALQAGCDSIDCKTSPSSGPSASPDLMIVLNVGRMGIARSVVGLFSSAPHGLIWTL